MRDQVFEQLVQNEVEIPRATYDGAASYVDEQLGYEITRAVFGAVAETKRRASTDRQMQAAVRLLRRAKTQEQVLAAADLERARIISR
jgi:hypothetical protein